MDEFNEEDFKELDELVKYLAEHRPKAIPLIKNGNRYEEVEKAANEIIDLALKVDKNAKITLLKDGLTGSSLCLCITTSLFVIDEIDKFCDSLKKANNFEVCPRTDGLVNVGIVFENAFVLGKAETYEIKF